MVCKFSSNTFSFAKYSKGIRLDSGDLAHLSKEARKMFVSVAKKYNKPYFENLSIYASNEISEEFVKSLNKTVSPLHTT